MVALGAVTVLLSAPQPAGQRGRTEPWTSWIARILAIALAIVSWGAYGPVLHKGQAAMHHSRLRPLICVGLAYFVIAVIMPYFFLGEMGESSTYASVGTLWSFGRRDVRSGRCARDHHGVQLGRQAGVCDAAGVRRGAGGQHVGQGRIREYRRRCFWRG